ncbi:SAM-dependent methyltransferase [Nocardia sp. R16R-3T]
MFIGALGPAKSYDQLLRIVRTALATVPSGSFLVIWDGTDDGKQCVTLCENYTHTGCIPPPQAEIRPVFDGLEAVELGFVSITQWRTDAAEVAEVGQIADGAVARKP